MNSTATYHWQCHEFVHVAFIESWPLNFHKHFSYEKWWKLVHYSKCSLYSKCVLDDPRHNTSYKRFSYLWTCIHAQHELLSLPHSRCPWALRILQIRNQSLWICCLLAWRSFNSFNKLDWTKRCVSKSKEISFTQLKRLMEILRFPTF